MSQDDWDRAFQLFHMAWGKNRACEYDKELWIELLSLLEKARAEDGVFPHPLRTEAPSTKPPPP